MLNKCPDRRTGTDKFALVRVTATFALVRVTAIQVESRNFASVFLSVSSENVNVPSRNRGGRVASFISVFWGYLCIFFFSLGAFIGLIWVILFKFCF